tara:strand:- start:7846 stop:9636 length:1791 start_codon:yes stop_codon:yes gene_type:complete
MARISEQTIEQVRITADIHDIVSEYVQLKKRGRNFFGLCPFHDEKTPSFSVNPERQIYKCFGCDAGGGTINFIMEMEQLEFIDAIKHLADRYKIELNIENAGGKSQDARTQLLELHEKTAHIYAKNLTTDEGKKVQEHLEHRGLTPETITKFKLGYSLKQVDSLLKQARSMDHKADVMRQSGLFIDTERGYIDRFRGRIMFSIADASNKIIAFAGRVFESDDPAKYVNSPETPIYNKSRVLYGLHASKQTIRKKEHVIIVEGYLDFLQLYQSGIENCVAISGTAFTEQHALQLKRYCNTVYIAYDGDSAGKAAAIRAGYVLLQAGISPFIINIPDGLDPDDWIKKDGNAPFLEALKNSLNLLQFHFDNYSGDLQSTAGKSSFINEVLLELAQIKDPIIRELHARTISELMKISITSVLEALQTHLNQKQNAVRYKNNNAKSFIKQTEHKSLVEEDLIRLCFADSAEIRKYLYDSVNTNWLTSNTISIIFDKIYIHLFANNPPEAGLIMDELVEKNHRNKLAEIIIDLDKIDINMDSAYDCIKRLEESWINAQLKVLRENLKNAEASNQDPISIMKQIDTLQKEKNKLSHPSSSNEI